MIAKLRLSKSFNAPIMPIAIAIIDSMREANKLINTKPNNPNIKNSI